MNGIGFLRLLRNIYSPRPDIGRIMRQGLLATKIGQTYALRIDFLRESSCLELAKLYRKVTRIEPAAVDALLAADTPPGWREAFASIDPVPLASASVGQVHRARLATGEDVVVKLVRPGLATPFRRDVSSVRRLLKTMLFFYPTLKKVADPLGILESIEENTVAELDLRNEAAGQKILRDIRDSHADRFDLRAQAFPRIHEHLSGETVMVSEFVPGPTLDEMLERGEVGYDLLLELFRVHGFGVFCIGTFHGDIHPGNIAVSGGKFWFLDTGAIGRVGVRMRNGLFHFFDALSHEDYPACAARLNEMADVRIEGARFASFEAGFVRLYAEFTGSTVSQVSLTRKMMETIKLGVRAGMVFERGMYPIIKSLMYLDGMVLRCNPQARLVRDMRQFIGDFKPYLAESPAR